MKQMDLFEWAERRPHAVVIDIMPAIIRNICSQPFPFPLKQGEVVTLRRNAA